MTIPTIKSVVQTGAAAVDSPNTRIATLADGRQFYLKSRVWHGLDMPIRLANELFYYAIAQDHGLPMPDSAIIVKDGVQYWGSQKILGRCSLTVRDVAIDPATKVRLKRSFRTSAQQRREFLRCMLLDLLLINTDRTLWNILGELNGDRINLAYFDHDRSFGWHGDANHAIRTVAEVPLASFLRCGSLGEMVVRYSTRRECNDLFAGLDLRISDLDRARTLVPKEWLTDAEYESLSRFMGQWWNHVKPLFRSRLIYTLLG